MPTAKEAARPIIEDLPDQATWDDRMYEFYVKQKIEAGLQASSEDKTVPHGQARARLLPNAD